MEDLFDFLENQMEPESAFEFDLGMCLGTLLDMIDNTEDWEDDEYEFMLCLASDLIEKFTIKYQAWMEEYAKRKESE